MKKSCILIFIVMTLFSCGRGKKEIEPIVRTVKIDTVRLSGGERCSVFSGKVKSEAEANLSFRVAGTIAAMPYVDGKFVHEGAVIAEIDDRDYRIQLSATEAEYNQIKATAERVIELYNRGSATQSDYEKAVYGLEQITAKYNAHKNQLHDTKLLAPFDGYIRKRIFEVGETVSAGMPVISMIGAKERQIEINLPMQDYARRSDFKTFEATVSTAPDKTIPLTLSEISPSGNANQLYKAVFRVKNPQEVTLAAGMSAEVIITYNQLQETCYEIPVSSLFERNGKHYVWLFISEDQPVKAKEVEVGEMKRDGYIVITKGLHEKDKIITAGVQSLKEGMKVKPLETPAASNVGGLL